MKITIKQGKIQEQLKDGIYNIVPENRTTQQNRALHKYFSLLAEELNNSGLDIRHTLKSNFNLLWSQMSVKELIWKPIQKALLKKESTTQLKKNEIDKVFLIIQRELGEKYGIDLQFPNDETKY